ncbi:Tim10/DDP family zinc finger-domain-containing protein [Scheffersomyces amazonensis]|uniref:Tim10/DDP family zinc finger-domain-containing protein n=1 Tax=Scheffersomyces amazonensis TaxID=1078765 RepID=UPI00315CB572
MPVYDTVLFFCGEARRKLSSVKKKFPLTFTQTVVGVVNQQVTLPVRTSFLSMSLFIGNTSQYGTASVDPEKIKIAEVQFIAQASTFNRMLSSCQTKCLQHHYSEGDLNTGEQSCIDRCVSKYVKTNLAIGNEFTNKRLNPYTVMPDYEKVQTILRDNVRDEN